MPNKTTNLGLTTWLESDVVDFEQINGNFQIIDGLVNCVEAGEYAFAYADGSNTNSGVWYYRKYSNGHLEMTTKLVFANSMICDKPSTEGATGPFYSDKTTIDLPTTFTSIYGVSMDAAASNMTWVGNLTGTANFTSITFRLLTRAKESEQVYKQVFITVKGKV